MEQTKKPKKQFSLSLLMRIFLGVLVLVSIGVFARSAMYVNELNQEAAALQRNLDDLRETRAELEETLGSAEEVKRLLSNREECQKVLKSDSATAEVLAEYTAQLERIHELLNSSKNRKYIEKVAKDELDLYFADEEIYYNDINK